MTDANSVYNNGVHHKLLTNGGYYDKVILQNLILGQYDYCLDSYMITNNIYTCTHRHHLAKMAQH